MTILLLDAALLALTLALARRKRLLASRDWLTLACSHADAPEHLAANSTQTLHGQREDPTLHPRMVERMIAATFELLGSDDFVAKTNPPPLHLLAPADSDWSGFAPWLLQRVGGAFTLMLCAKLTTIQVPFLFKHAVDGLSGESAAALAGDPFAVAAMP